MDGFHTLLPSFDYLLFHVLGLYNTRKGHMDGRLYKWTWPSRCTQVGEEEKEDRHIFAYSGVYIGHCVRTKERYGGRLLNS